MKISGSISFPELSEKKINIATPAYGGNYCSEYVITLYSLLSQTKNRDVSFSFSEINYSDIVDSRNYLISNFFFNKKDCSHILFMDSDMGFPPELIMQMINLKEDLVGAISPKRTINLEKLHSHGSLPFSKAYAKSLGFIGSPKDPHPANKSFSIVESVGAGILLISRQCIDKMIKSCPEIVDSTRFKHKPYATRFERFLTPFNKILLKDKELSEDISFCYRWTNKCRGKIYAGTDFNIKHVGKLSVDGKFSDL